MWIFTCNCLPPLFGSCLPVTALEPPALKILLVKLMCNRRAGWYQFGATVFLPFPSVHHGKAAPPLISSQCDTALSIPNPAYSASPSTQPPSPKLHAQGGDLSPGSCCPPRPAPWRRVCPPPHLRLRLGRDPAGAPSRQLAGAGGGGRG